MRSYKITIQGGKSKTDSALLFGFDTYAGFYKAFCREFGTTPSAFWESGRAKRPYRIDITKEDYMTVSHKKAVRMLDTHEEILGLSGHLLAVSRKAKPLGASLHRY